MRGGEQPRDDKPRDSFHCALWLLLKLWPNSPTAPPDNAKECATWASTQTQCLDFDFNKVS